MKELAPHTLVHYQGKYFELDVEPPSCNCCKHLYKAWEVEGNGRLDLSCWAILDPGDFAVVPVRPSSPVYKRWARRRLADRLEGSDRP